MSKHILKKSVLFALFWIVSVTTNLAHAVNDGVYAGTVPMDIQCIGPTFSATFSATMVLSVSGGSATLGVADALSKFNYGGTGTVSGASINTTGSAFVNFSSPIDDTYSPATFNINVVDNGSSLTVQVGSFGTSSGTNCSSLSYGLTANGTLSLIADGQVINPEVTPGTVLTTPQLFNTQLASIVGDIGTRANSAMRGFTSGFRSTANGVMFQYNDGLNAGDQSMPFGAWVSYSYNDFENDFAPTAFDGSRHGVLAGIDFMPWEKVLLGLTAGFETNNIDTTFNGGEQDTDGFTVAAYFGALLTDTFSVDGSFGYSGMDTDQFRKVTVGTTSTRITSSTDADRYFMTFNLNGIWYVDNWVLGARTGFLFARNNEDGFTESNGTVVAKSRSKLNQWNAGGDVAYSYGEWEPFARLSYQNDYSQTEIGIVGAVQPSFDNDDFMLGFGVRYFSAQGITGNLEYNKRLGRDNFDEDSISFTIRGEF